MPVVPPRLRRRWVTYAKHNEQQKALLDAAFSKLKGFVLTKIRRPARRAVVRAGLRPV